MRHLDNYPSRLILAIVGLKEQLKEIDMKEKEVHEKAIRLLEGGKVIVDGLSVKMAKCPTGELACNICKMDSICYVGTEMYSVCMECDIISRDCCYLILTHPG